MVGFLLSMTAASAAAPDSDWPNYGKDAARSRFSSLDQIKKDNVQNLHVAWVYHAGNSSDQLRTTIECNPLVIKGVMYVTTPVLEIVALDAASGREIWKFNPFPERPSYARAWFAGAVLVACIAGAILLMIQVIRRRSKLRSLPQYQFHAFILLFAFFEAGLSRQQHNSNPFVARVLRHILPDPLLEQKHSGPNRGLTFWEDGPDQRILFAGGHKLVALDAKTGRPITGFGKDGFVDLTLGLERKIGELVFTVTSPGVIYKDTIVIGSMVTEGPEPAASGDIQAYDVRTGRQKWTFHTVPHPGEVGYETWPSDAWKRVGGTNSWGGMTVDDRRGLVFVPIGSASFDFYGGDRLGKNLFSDSLVALRADTGKLVWYYQMIHHDLWDYDLACPPNLITLQRNGKPVDAVVEPLKTGMIFVLDRETGQSLFPVEERAVPKSDMPGEEAWPTQPFPLKPPALSRLEITENDLTDISPEAHAYVLRKFREVSGSKMFDPPSKKGTIVIPGLHGGANWSGASFDPRTARLVMNTNNVPHYVIMKDAKPGAGFPFTFQGYERFLDSEGYPGIKPPWGQLSAVDLNTGDVVWQVPLGEYKELTARGIPITGTENGGGSIITAGGLVFIAATKDQRFRAFDVDTGKVLWETKLAAAGHATPSTYSVDGKQYVVIAAGGGSMVESRSGDEYVAFALPDAH